MAGPRARIAIVDTRASNLHSVSKALERVGADANVTSDPAELASADAAVMPGVGASDAVMRALGDQGLIEPVRQFAASGRPLLCVCLGMQVLFDESSEGELPGLGIMRGTVERFPEGLREDGRTLKIPHMGWNSIQFTRADQERHPAFRGIPDNSYFYFVHSYRCLPAEGSVIAATTQYGEEVCAAVSRGAVAGTQFHPEKSGDIGLQIYENFVRHANKVAVG